MNSTISKAALPSMLGLCLLPILSLATLLPATPAAALTQSWNGYKWARTGNLAISIGNNLDSNWSSLMAPSASAWSADPVIDFVPAAGKSNAACAAVFGGVQVCNGNYGANGWLGYANVWLSGGFIVQATVRMNDYYFSQTRYNTPAWREMVMCQEIGHTLGLAHANTSRTNTNLGTCMDYSNDPSGTLGTNGTLANIAPSASDFAALAGIYANPNTTQLTSTRPQFRAGDGFSIDDAHVESFAAVPEPSAWALLVIGFGSLGSMLRRRRLVVAG